VETRGTAVTSHPITDKTTPEPVARRSWLLQKHRKSMHPPLGLTPLRCIHPSNPLHLSATPWL